MHNPTTTLDNFVLETYTNFKGTYSLGLPPELVVQAHRTYADLAFRLKNPEDGKIPYCDN